MGLDYTANAGGVFYDLQDQATAWLRLANPAITPEQPDAQLTTLMGIKPRAIASVQAISRSETDDILSRGHEVELHFNPTAYWTLQASVTEQQTINTNMAPNVTKYAALRMPYWTTIMIPGSIPPSSPANSGGITTTAAATTDAAPVLRRLHRRAAQGGAGLEGIARPQIRRYGGRLSTNFRLPA